VIIPILVGAFGKLSHSVDDRGQDMAFPFAERDGLWSPLAAGSIMVAGHLFPGGPAAAGMDQLSAAQFHIPGGSQVHRP